MSSVVVNTMDVEDFGPRIDTADERRSSVCNRRVYVEVAASTLIREVVARESAVLSVFDQCSSVAVNIMAFEDFGPRIHTDETSSSA